MYRLPTTNGVGGQAPPTPLGEVKDLPRRKRGSKARNYCITIKRADCPTGPKFDESKMAYLIRAPEVGDGGYEHWQCYAEWKWGYSYDTMNTAMGTKNAHFEARKGTADQAINYCKKDGKFEEFGKRKEQGTPAALQVTVDAILNGTTTIKKIVATQAELYYKYGRVLEKAAEIRESSLVPDHDITTLRPWQKELFDKLQEKPHPRHIYWYHDPNGQQGKSEFTRYLLAHARDDVTLLGGQLADAAEGWSGQRICVFDYPKNYAGLIHYGAIEKIKDGVIFSSKFHSRAKVYPRPHVVVFANVAPDPEAFTANRVVVVTL